jgi:hypothetical protein
VASGLSVFLLPETLPAYVRAEAKSHKVKPGGLVNKPKEWQMARLVWLVALFLVIDFGMIFTYPFVFPQFPFFLEKVLHYSTAQYGLLFSALIVVMLAAPLYPLFLVANQYAAARTCCPSSKAMTYGCRSPLCTLTISFTQARTGGTAVGNVNR